MIKKILILLFISLFLLSFISLTSASVIDRNCNQPGYAYCYESAQEDYYPAIAVVRIAYNNPKLINGQVVWDYFFAGDYLYFAEGMTSKSDMRCSKSGCSPIAKSVKQIGTPMSDYEGRYILSSTSSYSGCPSLIGQDYEEEGGMWAWVGSYAGWLGSGNCINIVSQPPPCIENWGPGCSEWSQCSSQGTQSRTCVDVNNCGTTKIKPDETRSCTPTFYRLLNNQCILLTGVKTASDYDTLAECQSHIPTDLDRISTFYRLANNQCIKITLKLSDRTNNDYNTQAECEAKISNDGGVCSQVLTDYYTLENNQCVKKQYANSCIPQGSFYTLAECQSNIIIQPPSSSTNEIVLIIIGVIGVVVLIYIIFRRRK